MSENDFIDEEKIIHEINVLFTEGKFETSIDKLHEFRYKYPNSHYLAQTYYLSGLTLYKLDQRFKAKYYLKQCIFQNKKNIWEIKSGFLLGQILYQDRFFEDGFNILVMTLEKLTYIGFNSISKKNLDQIYLILAEISLNQKKDKNLAYQYFININFSNLDNDSRNKYYLIQKKLRWNYLPHYKIGLQDGNISALCVDDDDIWIGTWNGGLARYTLSSGKSEVFTMGKTQLLDNAIRAIEITDNYVWVGTFYGLSVYSKASSKWKTIDQINGIKPEIISVIKFFNGNFFVGTLGSGLFVFNIAMNKWTHFSQKSIAYILSIENFNDNLLVGTMTSGINIFDLTNNSITNFQTINDLLPSKNITMILFIDNDLWIGSYGSGLFKYNFDNEQLFCYSKKSGEIADDWLLCGTRTENAVYFGTFGGGVSVYYPNTNTWEKLDLSKGLNSFDVASIASSSKNVYFGTLGEGVSIYNEQ
ncbi:MAG: hypothetical protein JXR70_05205 [Spirochaetales bacterium]|nr:hypothetical protein [Spirochaetales bacterium]